MCVHSVDGGEAGLHSLRLFVCVICAAYFSAAQGECTIRPYLPACKAKADGLGLRLENQDYSTYYTLLSLPYNTLSINQGASKQA